MNDADAQPWTVERLAATLGPSALLATARPEQCRTLAGLLETLRVSAGESVVLQGAASDRSMYICLSGQALVSRSGVEVQRLGPGEHFGELALVTGTPRAASVRALTDLELCRLSHEHYAELHAQDPALGRLLLEAVTRSVAGRLTDVTDGMRTLLRERALPRRSVIEVNVDGELRKVHPGTQIGTLLPSEVRGHLVVAGLVNRSAASLATAVLSNCALLPLTTEHWEGQRIYRTSLGLLLLEAAHRIDPSVRVHIEHSVGFGQRVRVSSDAALDRFADALEPEMRRLVNEAVPLCEELWTAEEAIDLFRERGLLEVVDLLATWREPAVPMVSYGGFYALGLHSLLSDAGRLRDFGVERDEGGLLLLYGRHAVARSASPPSMMPRPRPEGADARMIGEAREASRQTRAMTLRQDDFLRALSVTSVGAFNKACVDGKVTELIRVHEGFHEKAIGQIADTIAAQRDTLRIVCVAGPSSSGKTTFIRRLRVQLQVNGIDPVGLSLDDYYLDRERTPRDVHGEYDFEALEALDLPLLAAHLTNLLLGKRQQVARYDFPSGRSHAEGGAELHLGADRMLLLEGIHGLNPAIVSSVPAERVFRIFICPLTQLPFDHLNRNHASDLRLLRRIVRDRHQRATRADQNIERWPSVRHGERRHIFPFQQFADAVFDSSLVYEPAVLKVYAERYLLEVLHTSPAYTTAYRLLRLLDRFVTVYPDQVPPTSILREFIGGSGFEY
jgi:uridine kinase